MNAAFLPNIDIDPLEYGYLLKDSNFLPDMECQELPDDFSIPCSCLKCARANICPCQRKLIPCGAFCSVRKIMFAKTILTNSKNIVLYCI